MKLNKKLKRCHINIKASPIQGYGVFADQNILANEIIEECYTLLFPPCIEELENYVFESNDLYALPLGYGAIYNHSHDPNANFTFEAESKILRFCAQKNIKPGEEITIFYGPDWFASRNLKIHVPFRYRHAQLISIIKMTLKFFIIVGLIYIFTLGPSKIFG